MATLAEVNVKIGADIRQFQRGLRNAERDLSRTGKALSSIGANLSSSLTLPIAAAAAAAFKLSADFETSFTKIKTLVGIGGAQLDSFRDGIKSLSGPLGASQTDLSNALFVITSAGLRGDEALQALEQSSKATSLGLGETSDVARAAAAAVTAYRDAGLSSAQAIDQLTAIVREGNLEASELAPALGKVLPVAAQLGVSFAEVGANVATFSRLGVSAGESVSGLKALLANILKPSADAAKEFDRIGVSADELRKSIKERGLAVTLQELVSAYGDNTEGLSKIIPSVEGLAVALGTAGAQGEDYVRIVNSIANANGIVNEGFEDVSQTANFKLKQALVGLTNSATQFGSILIPVITGILDKINPLIQGFSNLSDGQKDLVVKGALVAASLGPILSITGGLISNFATLRKAVSGVVGIYSIASNGFAAARSELLSQGVAMSGLTVRIKSARAAFQALSVAQKATVFGLVIAGIAAAVVAFQNYNRELTTAEKAQKRVSDASATIAQYAAEEKTQLNGLITTLGDANVSQEKRKKALDKLQEIYPNYFKNLDVESVSLNQLTSIQDKLNKKILEGAAARAKSSALNEIAEKQIEKQLRLQEIQREGIEALSFLERQTNDPLRILRNAGESGEQFAVRTAVEALQKDIAELGNEAQQTAADFDSLFGGTSTKKVKTRFDFEDEEYDALNQNNEVTPPPTPTVPGLNFDVDNTNSQSEALAKLKAEHEAYTAVALLGNEVSREGNQLAVDAQELQALQVSGFETVSEQQKTFLEAYEAETDARIRRTEQLDKEAQKMQVIAAVGQAMGQAITDATSKGEKGFANLAKAALAAAAKIIKAEIQKGVAAAVSNALGTGPLGLILAPIAGAAAGALFQNVISSIGVPALADGGIAYGPTLAYVGEYGGASSNPEVIAPLSKLKNILQETSGGGGAVQVFGRLDGNDILLSSEGAAVSRARREGY